MASYLESILERAKAKLRPEIDASKALYDHNRTIEREFSEQLTEGKRKAWTNQNESHVMISAEERRKDIDQAHLEEAALVEADWQLTGSQIDPVTGKKIGSMAVFGNRFKK